MKVHRYLPILRRIYASRDQALSRAAMMTALHADAMAQLASARAGSAQALAERDQALAERNEALAARDALMAEIALIRTGLRRAAVERSPGQLDRLRQYRTRPFIVLMAVGRSGSTLLQGVLNSMPGCLVRGENGAFMLGLAQASEAICFARNHSSSFTTPEDSWFGCEELDADRLLGEFAQIVIEQLLGSRSNEDFAAIGFKEIRWLSRHLGAMSLWSYLRFFEAMFADVRFILLTREIGELLKSGWWPVVATPATRGEIEQFYASARTAPVRNLFELDYADLHEDSDAVRRLADFVGSRCTPETGRVFAKRHSYDTADSNLREQEIARLRAMADRNGGRSG